MAYATQDDLVPLRLSLKDLVELTSDTAQVDAAVVQHALDEASGTVDAYCGQRYKTPLQASRMVKQITVDLAVYILASRRRNTKPSETWTQRSEAAMSMLKDVAAGRASLDQDVAAPQPQTASADVTVTTTSQTFSDDNLRGFC